MNSYVFEIKLVLILLIECLIYHDITQYAL